MRAEFEKLFVVAGLGAAGAFQLKQNSIPHDRFSVALGQVGFGDDIYFYR
jgi:hypothetical protein